MTERIYYRDADCKEFEASIEETFSVEGRPVVELDQTCFYPEGGGQPCDTGDLGGVKVIDVQEREGAVLHYVESPGFEQGQRVRGRINWARRFDHMQNHTGQHILSQSFSQLLNAQTMSFHLGPDVCSIDLNLDSLEKEEIYGVEELANQVIFENREIKARMIEAEEQSKFPIRGHSSRTGLIRLVDIEDFDLTPCGGTHCSRTGAVGLLKVRRWEKVKQRARVEFFCGGRALKDYRWKNRAIYRLSRLYSTSDREVVDAVERQYDREKAQRKEIDRFKEEQLLGEAEKIVESSRERGGIRIVMKVWDELEVKSLQKLAAIIVNESERRVVLFGSRRPKPTLFFIRSRDLVDLDMGSWIAEAAPVIEGRGGGTAERAQAGGARGDRLEVAISKAVALLERHL